LKKRSLTTWLLLLPLLLVSFLFFIVITVRKWIYSQKKRIVSSPILTVGNVVVGGSGKTPLIMLILQILKDKQIAYISSGYRRQEKGLYWRQPYEVIDPKRAGDEATLIARASPQVACCIADDKWDAIAHVDGMYDILLLDDGLQRYDIPMHVKIATVDCSCPDGYGYLLPRGFLREPMSFLNFVDMIVLTNPISSNIEELQKEWQSRYVPPVFVADTTLSRFFSPSGVTTPLEHGAEVALISGIARPERFSRAMASWGYNVVDHLIGEDHKDILEEDLLQYAHTIRKRYPHATLVGTQKDFVRKALWPSLPLPLLFTETSFKIVYGHEQFVHILRSFS
jgi:tetraacyldisaccharide 4'-kinase